MFGRLDPEGSGEETERQRDRQIDHFKHAVDGDADDPERQQKQPDERIGNESQQRKRPAQNEQNAPEQEGEHVRPPYLRNDTSSGPGMFHAICPTQDRFDEFAFAQVVCLAVIPELLGQSALQSLVGSRVLGICAHVVPK